MFLTIGNFCVKLASKKLAFKVDRFDGLSSRPTRLLTWSSETFLDSRPSMISPSAFDGPLQVKCCGCRHLQYSEIAGHVEPSAAKLDKWTEPTNSTARNCNVAFILAESM